MVFKKFKQKQVENIMKKMNLNLEEIKSKRVIIESEEKKTIIKNPQVMIAKMMGKDVYQITGDVIDISEEDIKTVMEKTGKPKETVLDKLEELNSDLAKAIMELKDEKE